MFFTRTLCASRVLFLQVILQPPLPSVEELLADEAAAAADKSKKGGKPGAAAAKKPAGKDAKGGGKGERQCTFLAQ